MEPFINFNSPDFSRLLRNRVPNLNEMATHTSNTIKIKTTFLGFLFFILTGTTSAGTGCTESSMACKLIVGSNSITKLQVKKDLITAIYPWNIKQRTTT